MACEGWQKRSNTTKKNSMKTDNTNTADKTVSAPSDSLRRIHFDQIIRVDSDNDSRTTYNEEDLGNLKASLREDGMLENIAVGPPCDDGGHFLVWGFRRHKATELLLEELRAEGTTEALALLDLRAMMPCLVLTAEQVEKASELRLIENLQREGVDPVDEARGYRKLLDKKNADGTRHYTVESLVAALGLPNKGPEYVRMRLKLLDAPECLLEAIRMKEGPAIRVAEIIGKMVNPKQKEEMAKMAIKDKFTGRPMTVVKVLEKLSDYQTSLRGCDFDTKDPDLLKAVDKAELGFTAAPGECNDGSCEKCPLRSGNDPSLKHLLSEHLGPEGGTEGYDSMVCQNTVCFGKKQAAARRAMEANAEARGYRVMHKERVKEFFPYGNSLTHEGAKLFIRQDGRPDYECTGHMSEESLPTWGELLAETEVSWIIATPRSGGKVYLLERETAVATVDATPGIWKQTGGKNPFANRPDKKRQKAKGKGQEQEHEEGAVVDVTRPVPKAVHGVGASAGSGEQSWEVRQKERERVEAETYKVERVAIEQIGAKLKAGQPLSEGTWRALIIEVFENSYGVENILGSYLGLWVDKPEDNHSGEVEEKLRSMPLSPAEIQPLLLVMLAFGQANNEEKVSPHAPMVRAMAEDLGVDLAACRAMALEKDEGNRQEVGGNGQEAGGKSEKPVEELFTCDVCGGSNFTKTGLKTHNCKRRCEELCCPVCFVKGYQSVADYDEHVALCAELRQSGDELAEKLSVKTVKAKKAAKKKSAADKTVRAPSGVKAAKKASKKKGK
jgi:ParB-like chromosome segregation protein Spo0J